MIRTKKDLLYMTRHSIRNMPRIQRALQEGKIEFLGGFNCIPPWNKPGWIIKLTSRYKHVWYIAIVPVRLNTVFCDNINEVPWQYWDGDKSDNPLYQGDNPDEYRRLKNEKTEE